jgi:hypothetical protein
MVNKLSKKKSNRRVRKTLKRNNRKTLKRNNRKTLKRNNRKKYMRGESAVVKMSGGADEGNVRYETMIDKQIEYINNGTSEPKGVNPNEIHNIIKYEADAQAQADAYFTRWAEVEAEEEVKAEVKAEVQAQQRQLKRFARRGRDRERRLSSKTTPIEIIKELQNNNVQNNNNTIFKYIRHLESE